MKKHFKKQTIAVLGSSIALLTLATPAWAENMPTPVPAVSAVVSADPNVVAPGIIFTGVTYMTDSDSTRFHYVAANADEDALYQVLLPIKISADITGASNTYQMLNDGSDTKKIKLDYVTTDDGKMEFWVDFKGDLSQGQMKFEVQAKLLTFFAALLGSEITLTPGTAIKSAVDNGNTSSTGTASGNTSNSASDANQMQNLSLLNVTDVEQNGKRIIEFEVPQGAKEQELIFISYKMSNKEATTLTGFHSKVIGKFAPGKHKVELAVPEDAYLVDICTEDSSNRDVVLLRKLSGGGQVWANLGMTAVLPAATTPAPVSVIPVRPVAVNPLILTQVPTELNGKLMWKVTNPNPIAVNFTWQVEGTSQSGSATLNAGDDLLLAANIGGSNTLAATTSEGLKSSVMGVPSTAPAPINVTEASVAPAPSATTSTGLTMPDASTSTNTDSATGSANVVLALAPAPEAVVSPVAPSMAAMPAQSVTAPTAVAALSDPSDATVTMLPQTGEKTPVKTYAAGSILVLLGSLFLRKRKSVQ